MSKINIKEPHGYLLDDNGRVIDRFGNWETGERDLSEHKYSENIESVDYVKTAGDHDMEIHDDYKK